MQVWTWFPSLFVVLFTLVRSTFQFFILFLWFSSNKLLIYFTIEIFSILSWKRLKIRNNRYLRNWFLRKISIKWFFIISFLRKSMTTLFIYKVWLTKLIFMILRAWIFMRETIMLGNWCIIHFLKKVYIFLDLLQNYLWLWKLNSSFILLSKCRVWSLRPLTKKWFFTLFFLCHIIHFLHLQRLIYFFTFQVCIWFLFLNFIPAYSLCFMLISHLYVALFIISLIGCIKFI